MGLFQSRQDRGVEDIEITVARSYGYPSKYGSYFSSHFVMGGEKFKTVNPECFLFGDNSDLNYLNNKPAPFPYPSPVADEPSRTLRSLVHLRKDTLKLSRVSDDLDSSSNEYTIEFTFDADVACAVRIYLFAAENLAGGIARYTSRNRQSEPVFFQRGSNRMYSNSLFQIDPSKFNEEEFQYQPGGSTNEAMAIPIVIQITVEEEEFSSQCEVTFATLENSDGTYSIKPLKQKIVADGICYIIQEIYGIENKKDGSKDKEDDYDENGTECVICMCDMRDTLILPCRHLCLCNGCANSLRFQASNCPICRSPFHALLQIKAVRKKGANSTASEAKPKVAAKEGNQEADEYEEVPLVEALNGYLPVDGASGYSSRQSSARKSKSRNGSRPSSRKSRPGSRSAGQRSGSGLPPVDKLDHPIISRSCAGSDEAAVEPKVMAVKQSLAETKVDLDTACEDMATASVEHQDEHQDNHQDEHQDEQQDEPSDDKSEDLQNSMQSQALHDMIADASNLDANEIEEHVMDLVPSIDLSLPGTPLGSDFSNRSASSVSTQKTTSTTAGSGISVYSARGQVSTPSNVNIEDY